MYHNYNLIVSNDDKYDNPYECFFDFEALLKQINMSLKTEYLHFFDIRSYLAPNYSYDAFIKSYKCKLESFFPLRYL